MRSYIKYVNCTWRWKGEYYLIHIFRKIISSMKKYITKMDKFKKFFTRRLDRKQSKRLVKNPFVVLRILLIAPKFPIKNLAEGQAHLPPNHTCK